MRSQQFLICILLAILPLTANAVEIVRMNIQIGAVQYDLDLELYNTIRPITVKNFLSYVDDGAGNFRYDQSFIHRSVTDFVIQGGGFTFKPESGPFEHDPLTDIYSGGLQEIPADAPITNESGLGGLSNVRGTIAMARTSDPNSATSQWFINQVDNVFLDGGDGYAVFGRVLDQGMDIIDQIGAVPIYNFSSMHSAFGELPMVNYVNGDPVGQNNLVMVNSATVIQRPIVKADIDPIEFPFILVGNTATATITLSNMGNADLVMDGASLAALIAPFSIVAETCSNNTLSPDSVNPADTCSVTIQFSPVIAGNYQDNLTIVPSVNPFSISASLAITGEAIPTTPVLSVQNNITSLDFSDVAINTISAAQIITIQNRGGSALNLSSVTISGLDATEFSTDTGCSNTTILMTGESCVLSINFTPLTEGLKSAVLNINSDGGMQAIDLAGNGVGPEITVDKLLLDFGFVQEGSSSFGGFVIQNIGAADLEITSLVITGDTADFSLENTCPTVNTLAAQPMGKNGVCAIVVTYTPTSSGVKNAIVTITTNDLDEGVIYLSITGATGVADIDAVQQVDMGVAQTAITPVYKQITITNLGIAFLDFTAVNIAGVNASSYLVGHNCPGTPTTSGTLSPLSQNETCIIEVQFFPVTEGVHNARLEIASNDLDEPVFIIELTGLGEQDIDGIPASEEQNSPNNGDANNDNIQDNIQNNIASFLTEMGVYATIVSAPDALLFDVSILPNPSPEDMPQAANFKHGVFKYIVVDPSPVVTVGMLMPVDDNSNTYYKYGPTPDNSTPHWYNFSFDGSTGAQYIGQVNYGEVKAQDGSILTPGVNRSMFILSYIDGQRGDDDLTVNGEIVSVGALSSSATSSSDSGSISWHLLVMSVFLLMLLRSSTIIKIKP